MSEYQIHGFCNEQFTPVREAFERNFSLGEELGGAVAITIAGESVVDLWGGYTDSAKSRTWQEDTIVLVTSNTKIVTTLCGMMLVDRGLVDLDKPVADYWPEFAANGKETIPVRYLFTHSAGLPALDPPSSLEDMFDWDKSTAQLASQAPWFTPGTVSGYHGVTFGHLIGEIVRRTTKLSFQDFLHQEVIQPLGADFFIGMPNEAFSRLAEIVPNGSVRPVVKGSFAERVYSGNLEEPTHFNDPEFYRAVIPAANGVGNARSLTRICGALANGGTLGNVTLLQPDTCKQIYQEQIYTHDLVMDAPVRFGLGVGLSSKEVPIPFPNAFHWGGYGGSSTVMEPDRKACFSYVTNYFDATLAGDRRGARINRAAINCLEKI